MRSAPTLNIWITPCASVAMQEKLALLKIASCKAPAFNTWRGKPAATVRRYSAINSSSKSKTSTSITIAVWPDSCQASRPTASSTMALKVKASAMGQRAGVFFTVCMVWPGLKQQKWRAAPSTTLAAAHIRQQTAKFLLDHAITFADMAFQPGPVLHGDMAAPVTDEAARLQAASRLRHAFAAHAQHIGDQFLRHGQFAVRQAVHGQQQPAAQLLLDRVMAVAHGRLRHLRNQGLRIAQQEAHHRAGTVELVHQHLRLQAKADAARLHHGAAGRGTAAHEQRHADDAFIAHAGDFR